MRATVLDGVTLCGTASRTTRRPEGAVPTLTVFERGLGAVRVPTRMVFVFPCIKPGATEAPPCPLILIALSMGLTDLALNSQTPGARGLTFT